jgi:hypothetical protein
MDRPKPGAIGVAGRLAGGADAGRQADFACVTVVIFVAGGGTGADMPPIIGALGRAAAHGPNRVGGGGVDRREGCATRFGVSGPRPVDFIGSGRTPVPKRVGGGAGNARAACTIRFAISALGRANFVGGGGVYFIAAVRSFPMRVWRGPPSQGITCRLDRTYFAAIAEQIFPALTASLHNHRSAYLTVNRPPSRAVFRDGAISPSPIFGELKVCQAALLPGTHDGHASGFLPPQVSDARA